MQDVPDVCVLCGWYCMQVLGNAKGVVAALISLAIFKNPVTIKGAVGYGITVFGVILYSEVRAAPQSACCAMLCCVGPGWAGRCCSMLCRAVPGQAGLGWTVSCCVLCQAGPGWAYCCYAVLGHAMLCHAVLPGLAVVLLQRVWSDMSACCAATLAAAALRRSPPIHDA